jgi:prophage regulatory protein
MARQSTSPLRRTVRRHQLREMVPLADSTIYEMEQRGEFPQRFALSPRCVVWDLSEVEAWLLLRRSTPLTRTSNGGVTVRSKCRIELNDRHRRRNENWHISLTSNPGVDDVRPFLQHMPTLWLVFRLVIDAARRATVFMSQTFLDPVTIEPKFVEQR